MEFAEFGSKRESKIRLVSIFTKFFLQIFVVHTMSSGRVEYDAGIEGGEKGQTTGHDTGKGGGVL